MTLCLTIALTYGIIYYYEEQYSINNKRKKEHISDLQ